MSHRKHEERKGKKGCRCKKYRSPIEVKTHVFCESCRRGSRRGSRHGSRRGSRWGSRRGSREGSRRGVWGSHWRSRCSGRRPRLVVRVHKFRKHHH